MRIDEFPILADENIHPDVVAWFRGENMDIVTVAERSLQGRSDHEVLASAMAERRVVLTHDSDFGTLAIAGRRPITGILYLRPGHIDPGFTIQSLQSLRAQDLELRPPFIVVLQRTADAVSVRLRQL